MNKPANSIVFWSITVALGGFLFGFDTAVISGAEQSIQQLWNLSDAVHGFAVAIALYGTVIGAFFGGWPANRFGRKKTLFWIALLYLVSALGSALAPDQITFMIFRFIGGLGVGASSVVAPMYISEVSPSAKRGRLVALFQFNIVLGILIAYVSNYLISGINEDAWRIMVGIEAVPALVFAILIRLVPESPRWLILMRNDVERARKTIEVISPGHVEVAIQAIKESAHSEEPGSKNFFSGKYRFPILLAVLFAFFNQMTGINAIIYYAPRIFSLTGVGDDSALISTAGIGVVNMLFTLVGMGIIDRFGRKTLMYVGSFGLILTLAAVSRAFYTEQFSAVPLFLFGFIAFFAMSQGAVIWVYLSEIFPNHVRAQGQSLGSFTHWILAALVANVFPYFVNTFSGGPIFLFFMIMMIFQLIYVWKIMPETKGVSLEELEKKLTKS